MKTKKPPLLEIEWADASGAAHWQTEDELANFHKRGAPVKSIGWEYLNNNEGITIVHGVGPEGTFLGSTFVPRGMIRKTRKIRY